MKTTYPVTLTGAMTHAERCRIVGRQDLVNADVIVAALTAKPDQTMSQIARVTGLTMGHCAAALMLLQDQGRISAQGSNGQTYAPLDHGLPAMPAAWSADARAVYAHLEGRTDTIPYMAGLFGWDRVRVRKALGRLYAMDLLRISAVRMLPIFALRGIETRRAS
ncbi:hypothetical protein GCM10017784_35240 [Deinococcus indicus]|uniref:hypothetical protein n=1 Tax=Deinococcus indicus TaxID=223556 RepID=UPI00174A7D76|nr:hypothetical protein [Deinococcus indicus]GHG37739.1 hypothetical protein GCM10017784_35240 [Deinococcus indicus]